MYVEKRIYPDTTTFKEVQMAEVTRLAAWDCEYCDTKGMWGNEWDCNGCGRPRSRRVRFYQVPNAPIVTPEIKAQMGAGSPNWYCEHCDSGNKDRDTHCQNCGAERGSSPVHEVRDYKSGPVPHSTEEAAALDDDDKSWVDTKTQRYSTPVATSYSHQHESSSYQRQPRRQSSWRNTPSISNVGSNLDFKKIGLIGAAIVGVILVSLLIYNVFFNTHPETAYVNGYSWSQSVTVQEFQVVHDSSWGSHPADAYNVTSDWRDTGRDEKVHDGYHTETYTDTCYETVNVPKTCQGTRDNGDGTITTYDYDCSTTRQESYSCTKERQVEDYHYEDIYDWYYTYDVNRWRTIATHPTSGNNHEPYFATDFALPNPYSGSGDPQIGQTQSSQNLGTYTVTFCVYDKPEIGTDGCFTREYSLSEWQRFEENTGYEIEVNVFNAVMSDPVP